MRRQDSDNACNVPYTMKAQYGVPQTLFVTNPSANASIYAEVSFDTPEGFGVGSVKDWEIANNLPNNPINCILGNGASDFIVNDTDVEAQLDTQMITGMAAGAKTCFYIMQQGASWMYEFANQIFITPNAPLVVSMSYGWVEFEQCINETDGTWFLGNCTYLHIPDSKTYVQRTNVEFMKLGSLGHTLLAASGDDGVCGTHGSPNGCTAQGPIFPAASPYVLTVGATSIEASNSPSKRSDLAQPPICTNQNYGCECTTSTNEQIASQSNTAGFDTGGGFSVFSAQASFQTQAINAYLNSGVTLPSRSYQWNPANRGFPDIAAIGENVCVIDPGTPCEPIGGTSASCPLIASLVTLLNQDRLNAGKTPLGYVNQVIYAMFYKNSTQYFTNNFSQQTNGGECGTQFGFYSQPGLWSPLVGVGSPVFPAIRQYVSSLP
jgi:subtilase family serine protease